MARETGGWTRFFSRKDIGEEEPDFLGTFMESLARIFEGSSEEDTYRQIRGELVKAFNCEDLSLFVYDPDTRPGYSEGDWVLEVKSGFGEGNRVSWNDTRSLPDLQLGKPVACDDELAHQAALKAVALAFEEDAYYGCDIEKGKVVLVKDPTPEDDMGSGDLSVLAIPLRFENKAGRVTERARVGVLALFKTPVRRELAALEGSLRSILAHAIVAPRCQTRDPVTNLFTESFLKEELGRQLGLFELTGGKLRGGMVVGMIDTLKMYKQTLESAGKVDPAQVSQKVSDVLRGVGECLWKRCKEHNLDQSDVYKSGYPGRMGREGFGVVLPLLQPHEMCMWAVRMSKEVVSYRFEAEELLLAGDVTVSLRVIPFARGTLDELWGLAVRALESIGESQMRARRDPDALGKVVNTILIFDKGRWITTGEFVSGRV